MLRHFFDDPTRERIARSLCDYPLFDPTAEDLARALNDVLLLIHPEDAGSWKVTEAHNALDRYMARTSPTTIRFTGRQQR